MRRLMFSIGSLGVAICFVLLLISALVVSFVGRELSSAEKVVAVVVSCVVGVAWWSAVQRRLKRRALEPLAKR